MASSDKKSRFGKKTTALEVVAGTDLNGKTYFITGANSGIGLETARALASRGGHIVMGCRSLTRAAEARDAILKEKPDAKIDVIQLDNGSLQSVYECAEKYKANGWPLHCLILNAGAFNPEPRITVDEFEATFQTNHLAHFLLTNLLTPLLIANAPSRIVVVASIAHQGANVFSLGPADITWKYLSPTKKLNNDLIAYNVSKMCNVLHAKALHERLSSRGVTVNSLHPGVIRTNIANNSKLLTTFVGVANDKTPEQGASTTVYCAVCPDLKPDNGGLYYDNCRPKTASRAATNLANAERLWALSEEMLEEHRRKRIEKANGS